MLAGAGRCCPHTLSLQEGLCLRHPPHTSPDAQALTPEEQGSLGGRGGSAALPGFWELRGVRGAQRLLGCSGGTYAWLPHGLADPRGKGPTTALELCGSERLASPAECCQEPRRPSTDPAQGLGRRLAMLARWVVLIALSDEVSFPSESRGQSSALVSEPAVVFN